MPIVVSCPGCATMLSAPDNAAGKCVRCPKSGCGALAEVPAFLPVEEVAVVDATPVRKPKPARAKTEDDRAASREPRAASRRKQQRNDDDQFSRPRKPKRKASGIGAGAIVAIVMGTLLALGSIGFGIYSLTSKKSDPDSPSGFTKLASPPAGWQQFTYPDDGFKAYFPQVPIVSTSSEGKFHMPVLAGRNPDSFTIYLPRQLGSGVFAEVIVANLRSPFVLDRHDLITQMRKENGEVAEKPINWLGKNGYEIIAQQGHKVCRVVLIDKTMYIASLASFPDAVSPQVANSFFDNFELLK